MSDELQRLEQLLLQDPFDTANRSAYAGLLEDAKRHADALTQWRLVCKATPQSAEPWVRAALCAADLEDTDAAADALAKARACSDFDPGDPRLARFAPPEAPAARLYVLPGGRVDAPIGGNVISIRATDKRRFTDIVGMTELKKLLRVRIIEPFINPGLFARFKKNSGGGVLLYGPPGCGKTLIARAIATECGASFTAIGISDVLNMWVGASERNLAAVFEKARSETPAVLFFDELDALAFSRSKAHSDHTRTLVNEFLNQLDGMTGSNDRLLVLAATNMPWDVDDAMKRPGRFDRQIFVPPPDAAARAEMLRLKLSDVPTDPYDAALLAAACPQFSGADIDGVIEHAKDDVLAEILDGAPERNLRQADLLGAIQRMEPSTSEWLKTARNLVKFGGGTNYKDVEQYLRSVKLY